MQNINFPYGYSILGILFNTLNIMCIFDLKSILHSVKFGCCVRVHVWMECIYWGKDYEIYLTKYVSSGSECGVEMIEASISDCYRGIWQRKMCKYKIMFQSLLSLAHCVPYQIDSRDVCLSVCVQEKVLRHKYLYLYSSIIRFKYISHSVRDGQKIRFDSFISLHRFPMVTHTKPNGIADASSLFRLSIQSTSFTLLFSGLQLFLATPFIPQTPNIRDLMPKCTLSSDALYKYLLTFSKRKLF